MTIRYVAFVEGNEYVGFCQLIHWPQIREIDPDIERIVEFDGPDDEPGFDVEVRFEALKQLAEAAVVNDLRRILKPTPTT
jgi:hypothetical protein